MQFSKSCLNIATCVHCCTNHTHAVSRHQLVRHVRCDQMLRMSGLSKIFFVCRRQDRACAKKWRRRKSKLFAKGFLCKPACGGTPYLLRHQAFQRLQYLMRNSRGTHEGIPAASLSLVLSRVTDKCVRVRSLARPALRHLLSICVCPALPLLLPLAPPLAHSLALALSRSLSRLRMAHTLAYPIFPVPIASTSSRV